jgi:hypothetical protein
VRGRPGGRARSRSADDCSPHTQSSPSPVHRACSAITRHIVAVSPDVTPGAAVVSAACSPSVDRVAKSRRKRQRKRGPTPPPAQRRRLSKEERALAAQEREIERALAEIQRRAAEAHAPDTPPEVVAAILAEDFEEMPSPAGFTETLAKQSSERVRAVAAEVQRLAPGSLVALTFTAEVARILDGDLERSVALLEEAIDVDRGLASPSALGMHLIAAGMVLQALDAAEECLDDDPGDETGQTVLAAALGRLHARAQAGERLTRTEREALARFADRELLYRVRDSIGAFVEQRPTLQQLLASTVREWLEQLDEDGVTSLDDLAEAAEAGVDGRYKPIIALAIERAWLLEQDEEGDDDDDWLAPELEDPSAPLALLAADPGTPVQISLAARDWLETCTYGLWQVADPAPGPGVWLTEIVSGARRYAAIPSEQLQHASRWSVFLGALVAIDGVWRSTGTLVPMRPAEGDRAAAFVHEATDDLSGKRVRARAARSGDPMPHGVLVETTEPVDPMLADLISKIICNLLPVLAGELWERRASVVDPRRDTPPVPLGGSMPFGASQEAIDAWLGRWSSERIPALGRLTPRVAARRQDKRPRLEALLRELEYDADQLTRDGEPAPDIGRLRLELGMTSWWRDT